MKKLVLVLVSLMSMNAMAAEYTCNPVRSNDFETDQVTLRVDKKKVFYQSGNRGETAKFSQMRSATDDIGVHFSHALYEDLSNWYGEGIANVHVSEEILEGQEKGMMAVSWCKYFCYYDYFKCYRK